MPTIQCVTTVGEIAEAVADRTRMDAAPEWDPVGIQIGDPGAQVDRIAICHEVTEDVVRAIEASPVDLLVSYHPLLFAKTNRVRAGRSPEARTFRLIRQRVNLIVTHTDFDSAEGGASDALAHVFRLRNVEPFGADQESGLPPIGRVGGFEGTLAVLDAIASDTFGHTGLRISGDRNGQLNRVSVVPGSGASFIDHAATVSDAIVTGDVSHHAAVRALDLGLAVVDPGHTATERPGMESLVGMIAEITGLDVVDLTTLDPRTWS